MVRPRHEVAKFLAFLGTLMVVVSVQELLGLDWFYAGFFLGVIVGGLLFQDPLKRRDDA